MNKKNAVAGGEWERAEAAARLERLAGKMGQLTSKQQKAVGLLMAGASRIDVAAKVNVCRATIYNWTHRNEQFIAAMASWQRDMTQAARSRLLGLSGLGYKAIGLAMEKGDAKVALAVFKGLGVLDARRGEEEKEEKSIVIRRRSVERVGGNGLGPSLHDGDSKTDSSPEVEMGPRSPAD